MLLRRSLFFHSRVASTARSTHQFIHVNIPSANNSPHFLALLVQQQHPISGIAIPTTIHATDIKICDLKQILDEFAKGKECQTELNLITLEIQRRLRRVEKVIKAAPYAGGAFIQTYIYEARDDLVELENVVKIFSEKLGKEYVEKFEKKVEKMREDAKEVEYDSDLI